MITSEQLRSQIVLQTNTPTRDTNGAEIASWADTYTVRARKAHKNSREFVAAHKVNSETTDLFVIRYRTGIINTMRVKFGLKYYNIIGANDSDDHKREIHILCKEVV